MILAFSRSPRAINLKFTPEIFLPQKKSCMPMDIATFHSDKWENDRESLCHLFVDCHIKNTFDRLLCSWLLHDPSFIHHLPGLFFDFIVKKYEI